MKYRLWIIWLGILTGSLGLISMAVMLPIPGGGNKAPIQAITDLPDQKIIVTQTTQHFEETCSLKKNFPIAVRNWCKYIQPNARQNHLEPDFIAAVMTIESGGDPKAISSSGAVGLMQVMPKDGLAGSFTCLNGPCFAHRPSLQSLLDPEFNVSYGTKLLAELFGRTGDLRETLRAYGPRDVDYSYADQVLKVYQNQ